MSAPKVVTAILNWNGQKWLEKFLPSVCNSTYPNHHVLVIDNASTDDSVSFLQKNYPEIQIVVNPTNSGFAGGYNQGLQNIEADYYAILNSDVEVDKHWLNPLVDRLENNKNIAAAQPKILAYKQKDHFEYAGAAGGYIDKYGFPFCRGRIFFTAEQDLDQYNTAQAVFWATGAALFIRASVFNQLKGFDADFFAHMEEIDLCWRIQNTAYQVWVEPKSVVYHVGGGTLGKENPHKTYLNFRNNLIMMAKNLPFWDSITRIFIRLVLDGQAALKELLSGNPGFFIAIIKAHIHFYLFMPNIIKKRKLIKNKTPFSKLNGVFQKSIVWHYFAKRRKKFSDLNF